MEKEVKIPIEVPKGKYISYCNFDGKDINIKYKDKLKIALLFVCLNAKYWPYLTNVINDAKTHFLPHHDVDYLIWSDMPSDIIYEKSTVFSTEAVEWPMPTLMRYHLFLQQEEKLKEYDYIFYLDADMRIVDFIGDEILGEGLTVAEHPMYALRKEYFPPYEPNINSSAYVPRVGQIINEQGKSRFKPVYAAGGFQGGKTELFIEAMKTMKENIDKDFAQNYVAIWNDECLAKGTKIRIMRHDANLVEHYIEILIENIQVGDSVVTRNGCKKVLKKIYQGRKKVINRAGVWATLDHPFITTKGIKHCAKLVEKDELFILDYYTDNFFKCYLKEWEKKIHIKYDLYEQDIRLEIKRQVNLSDGERAQVFVAFQRMIEYEGLLCTDMGKKRLEEGDQPYRHVEFWEWAAYKIIKYGFETDVYDLTIEDEPEFFANGVLVHNSHWNRYLFDYKGEMLVLSPSYVYPDSLIKEYYEPIWGKSLLPKIITLTKPFTLSKEGGEHIRQFFGEQKFICPTCKDVLEIAGHRIDSVVECLGSGKPHQCSMTKI